MLQLPMTNWFSCPSLEMLQIILGFWTVKCVSNHRAEYATHRIAHIISMQWELVKQEWVSVASQDPVTRSAHRHRGRLARFVVWKRLRMTKAQSMHLFWAQGTRTTSFSLSALACLISSAASSKLEMPQPPLLPLMPWRPSRHYRLIRCNTFPRLR